MAVLFFGGPCVFLRVCSSSATCWAAIVSEKPNVAKIMSRMAPIFVFKQLHLHMLFNAKFFISVRCLYVNYTIKSFL